MNLSQRQIRAFLAIARLQSFTRAAEQLHITQAGLSSLLRDVETQLDCRLFDRTTRTVSLTAQGRAFVPRATRVLEELDGAAAALGSLSEARQKILSVGATPLVASCVVPAACRLFERQNQSVTVKINDLERTAIQEQVDQTSIDVGYGAFLQAASGIRRRPLLETELVLIGKKTQGLRSVSWKALQSHRLVCLPIDNPIQKLVDSHLAAIGRSNEPRSTFNYLHTVLAMVEAGMGSAILPSFVASAASRYQVSAAFIKEPRVALKFFEITKKGSDVMPVVTAFSECLVDAMTAFITKLLPGSCTDR